MHRIAIMGAGGWGTALGVLAGRAGHAVRLWSRNVAVVESINRERVNRVYLAAHRIEGDVWATTNTDEALHVEYRSTAFDVASSGVAGADVGSAGSAAPDVAVSGVARGPPGRVQAARSPLADSARAIRVQGAPARM